MRSRARWDWDRRECVSGERGGLEQGDLGERKTVSSFYGGDEEEEKEDGPFVVLCKKKKKSSKLYIYSAFVTMSLFPGTIEAVKIKHSLRVLYSHEISLELVRSNVYQYHQKQHTRTRNFKHRKITQPTQTQNEHTKSLSPTCNSAQVWKGLPF